METTLLTSQASGTTDSGDIAQAFGSGSEASDLFTKLLVAQIQNQNPLEPTDPSQFVNQLTQLSQMESLQALTQQSAASTSMMESMQVLALGGQVGSHVMVRSEQLTLGDTPVSGVFYLDNASAQTELVLTGADGVEHTLALGTRGAGEVAFSVDPDALGLPPGTYSLQVRTSSDESPSVEVAGQLTSVKLSPTGGVVLQVSNLGLVAPESITQFNGQP